eukprot:TRINITY_DN4304_c0_g1_i2.p3 TRINITY_DN4304_c0_g1~~TRINITY_DN4304_c0_g1_i2.p3  ORF type:complete len:124 (+),score=19.65 TRINITY_DN4304_c0_g1_i2:473-844(+)
MQRPRPPGRGHRSLRPPHPHRRLHMRPATEVAAELIQPGLGRVESDRAAVYSSPLTDPDSFIQYLDRGTRVTVVEVRRLPQRPLGRIVQPIAGWVTLRDGGGSLVVARDGPGAPGYVPTAAGR